LQEIIFPAMALFNPIRKKTYSETVLTPTFIPLDWVSVYLSGSAGAIDKKFLDLYLGVPELQAIINYKARVFAGMKIKAVDQNDEERDIPQLGIFAQPNPLQNFKEFAMQYYVLRSIFGNEYTHPIYGGDKMKTQTLWNLPPMEAEVIPIESNQIVFNMTKKEEIIKEYRFKFNGKIIKYKPDEIIHYNDNQVRFDKDKLLVGDSKLRPLVHACGNIKAAYEARGVLIKNSALGILSNESKDQVGTVPLTAEDKKQLQEDHKKYGLTKDKWQLILTNASLKWQSMAVETGKLKLFEEVTADFCTIANAFSFPPEILLPDTTYENKEKAIRQLYHDAIIPEADEWLQGLSNFMGLDNINFVSDFSHIAALQADKERGSRALNMAATGLAKALGVGIIETEEAKTEFNKYLI